MGTLHILQHAPYEGPGWIEEWAALRGWKLHVIHVYLGEALPDPSASLRLALMGGGMNIYQHREHPWLVPEKKFLSQCISAGGKAFGICLGAQLLADVLGSKIVQNPVKEIGWFPVEFTPEARFRFPGFASQLTFFHWHGDTFALPRGAMRLGSSLACAEQGFFWEERILGLQFHPEMKPSSLNQLLEGGDEELKPAEFVQSAERILSLGDLHIPAAQEFFFLLLDSLFLSQ